ncbi:MAG: hypothetical protein ACRD6W_12125, partial [Nitrososphaerales archaeon]
GTAYLWGGSVVLQGGPTTTGRTLRQVTVGGRRTAATCHPVAFHTSSIELKGCLLSFHVPAGRKTIVATP